MTQFDVPASTAGELQAKVMDAKFHLTDADGRVHLYTLDWHRTSDGEELVAQLMGIGAKPLLRMISAGLKIEGAVDQVQKMVRDAIASDDADEEATSDKIVASGIELISQIDFAEIGEDIHTIVRTTALGVLAHKILAQTNRDGLPLFSNGVATATFEHAYKRNWVEYGTALWQVIESNRFFPLLSTLLADEKPTKSPGPSEKLMAVPVSSE